MERYLLSYLRDFHKNPMVSKWIDYLKVDLDGYIYAYGDNMNKNYPMPRSVDWKFYAKIAKSYIVSHNAKRYIGKDHNILSFYSLPSDLFANTPYKVFGSIVEPVGNKLILSKKLLCFYLFYAKLVRTKRFNEIITEENIERFECYWKILINEYSKYNFKGLFVGDGEPFMLKLHIDMFRQLGIPSFVFLHGIPGVYDLDADKSANYMLVWGEQIRENYINAGFDPSRIIVTGHPRYKSIPQITHLRNDLNNVLVTTTASVSWSPHGWEADKFPLYDRSLIVLFAYSVQNVLQQFGVKKARLRVHPSVGKEWILNFVDTNFYLLDYIDMHKSIKDSSLVIGPTSTMWLNCLLEGVNYLVYEPSLDGVKKNLVPPFDGSDTCLHVANSEKDLASMIRDHYIGDLSIIDRYISPFDLEQVSSLLK